MHCNCSNTFARVEDEAEEYWSLLRYRLVTEYQRRPPIPPPFIVIWHALLLIRAFCFATKLTKLFPFIVVGLQFLEPDRVTGLHLNYSFFLHCFLLFYIFLLSSPNSHGVHMYCVSRYRYYYRCTVNISAYRGPAVR